jgi:hypothetical protein
VAIAAPASAHHGVKPTLTGTVIGDNGEALRGAHVSISSSGTVVAKAIAGRDGKYRARVPAGTYDVTFSCNTYASLTDTAVVVGETSTSLDATLTRLPILTGTVTDGTSALRGVWVKVMNGSTVVGAGVTGRSGVYKVYVAEGTYTVTFSRYGYSPLTDTAVAVTAPSVTLDAVLNHLPELTGTVTGEGGAPVQDARVKVLSGTTVVGCAETDSTGVYHVAVAEGTYTVQISACTYAPFSNAAVAVTAPSTTFDATLTRLPLLTGTVTGDGGAPLPHARVIVKNASGFVACGQTDENGVYKVYVADGTYDVVFCARGYQPLTDPGVITTGPSTTLDTTLSLAVPAPPCSGTHR